MSIRAPAPRAARGAVPGAAQPLPGAHRGTVSKLLSRTFLGTAFLPGLASTGFAHEVRPANLEMVQQAADTWEVLFKVPAGWTARRAPSMA